MDIFKYKDVQSIGLDVKMMSCYYTKLFQYMATLDNPDGVRFKEFLECVNDKFPRFPYELNTHTYLTAKNMFLDLFSDLPEMCIFGNNSYVCYDNKGPIGSFILVGSGEDNKTSSNLDEGMYGLFGVQKFEDRTDVRYSQQLIDSLSRFPNMKELYLMCSNDVFEKVWSKLGFENETHYYSGHIPEIFACKYFGGKDG